MPKLSVMLPVYNAQRTISRAIKSILEQTFNDLELIVVDDGSTDSTRNLIGSINDSRIKYFFQPHQGVAAASNLAFNQSGSQLVARMDADDFAHTTKFEKQVKYLTENELDVVGCKIQIRDASGGCPESMLRYQKWINEISTDPAKILSLRFVEFPLVNPTILAKRKYFEIGFDTNALPEDYDLFLTAAANGMKFGKVPEVLFDWTERDDRLTRTEARYSTEAFDECRKKHLKSGPLKNVTEVDLWGAGKTGKRWMRWLIENQVKVRRLFDVSPRKIGKDDSRFSSPARRGSDPSFR